MTTAPRTLFEKIWDEHLVRPETESNPAVLYVDVHLVHEVTSPQAFTELRNRGARVRRPDLTLATMDHSTPTTPRSAGRLQVLDTQAAAQLQQLETNCDEFGIRLFGLEDSRQGIVHVIGPEQGLTQPGMTIVCGDSHTSTHGAFGALAFGIGTSEVGYVLATQTLLQRKPRNMEVRIDGELPRGVSAKDIILAVIAEVGIGGATGHVLEYTGSAIRALGMEQRMTICNMSIEAGARAGLIAPDEKTAEYIKGRPFAPTGDDWYAALARWRNLVTDEGARYDRSVHINAADLAPMITFGTNPSMAIPIDGHVPDPADAESGAERTDLDKALHYMSLEPGQSLLGHAVDVVFVGSCTNSRISDLRQAATVMRGRHVAPGVRMLVVPGSRSVKSQAEAEGLDRVFKDAGAEWREAGCSMCIAMNGDQLEPGQSAVSTSNRNFEGRQGKGGRTFLASPLTAAATAIAGSIADVRMLS
ncbi:MAG TPA: 3-isopropylmalate dehydratase large subunit [Gemmatimonadaceae bacterium]|jgi:3-isopropylmalate/(R)-2-methylmalate dehydratase large subunit|nr:3-isopropylmalate dehydratase large subunit [Gemmatimonadaceae bacterium]